MSQPMHKQSGNNEAATQYQGRLRALKTSRDTIAENIRGFPPERTNELEKARTLLHTLDGHIADAEKAVERHGRILGFMSAAVSKVMANFVESKVKKEVKELSRENNVELAANDAETALRSADNTAKEAIRASMSYARPSQSSSALQAGAASGSGSAIGGADTNSTAYRHLDATGRASTNSYDSNYSFADSVPSFDTEKMFHGVKPRGK